MRFAWIDEPPFGYLDHSGTPTGCDVALARAACAAVDEPFEPIRTTFAELLPGLADGRWDVTTGMFITAERSTRAHFTRPIWTLRDGLLTRGDRPPRPAAAAPTRRLSTGTAPWPARGHAWPCCATGSRSSTLSTAASSTSSWWCWTPTSRRVQLSSTVPSRPAPAWRWPTSSTSGPIPPRGCAAWSSPRLRHRPPWAASRPRRPRSTVVVRAACRTVTEDVVDTLRRVDRDDLGAWTSRSPFPAAPRGGPPPALHDHAGSRRVRGPRPARGRRPGGRAWWGTDRRAGTATGPWPLNSQVGGAGS